MIVDLTSTFEEFTIPTSVPAVPPAGQGRVLCPLPLLLCMERRGASRDMGSAIMRNSNP